MGIVIPFPSRTSPRDEALFAPAGGVHLDPVQFDAEQAVHDALAGGGDRYNVLEAADQLMALCRDRYGFTVMQDGLPRDPGVLADTLVGLLRGLALLQGEFVRGRVVPGFGVYFGRPALAWFEDGCGGRTGLAVPDRVEAAALAAFALPRLKRIAGR